MCEWSETRQRGYQTNHQLSDVHRKSSKVTLFSFVCFLLCSFNFDWGHIGNLLLLSLSLWLFLVVQRLMESWRSAALRKSLNRTGLDHHQNQYLHHHQFIIIVIIVLLCIRHYILLSIRYAFLFDKAVIICKKKSGEMFEYKEIIELHHYQIRDEATGEKDNKKVIYIFLQ